MSRTDLIAAAQSDTLLREIEQQTEQECRAVTAVAEREARTLVSEARRSARRRAHDAIEELRNDRLRRLDRAKAKIETDARQHAQRSAIALIERAWPLLGEALLARWRDKAERLVWATAVARCARKQIRAVEWVVEHPTGWGEDEKENFRRLRDAEGAKLSFVADPNLAAGIRIKAGGAVLDATPEGLLADRSAVAGLLLADADREAIAARARPGSRA